MTRTRGSHPVKRLLRCSPSLIMLDGKDRAILDELRKDSRRSTKAIAEDLNMPRATVHERIRRMHDKGIIRRFTVIPDHSLLGESITAFILVTFLPHEPVSQRTVAEIISAIDGVQEVHLISGEYDMMVKVRGNSLENVGALVIDRIRNVEGVGRTITCAAFTTVKEEY